MNAREFSRPRGARRSRPARRNRRQGMLLPALLTAFVVVMLAAGLVLDALWLDMSQREAEQAAEAGALSAARVLACDAWLKPSPASHDTASPARLAAAAAAAANTVAGEPALIDDEPGGDVRLGHRRYRRTTGAWEFEDTDILPTAAAVTVRRSRASSNPVALFLRGITGRTAGDVAAERRAAVQGRVVGLQPLEHAAVPLLPLAILLRHAETGTVDTWETQIERRRGPDRFFANPYGTGVSKNEGDQIPEMELRGLSSVDPAVRTGSGPARPQETNVRIVEFRRGGTEADRLRQIQQGVTRDDLADFGGELRFDGRPGTGSGSARPPGVVLPGTPRLSPETVQSLRAQIGSPRIVLLYTVAEQAPRAAAGTEWEPVRCVGMAAARILDVAMHDDGTVAIAVQPTIVATRAAVVGAPAKAARRPEYVFRLSLVP